MTYTEHSTTHTQPKARIAPRDMAMIGLMAAVTCVLAPLSIPIGPVPISLTNLVLYFSIYLLGTKNSLISYVIYLLLGLVGLPVFSGFTGGPAKLAGPTGGYLIGFLLMIFLAGLFINHGKTTGYTKARRRAFDLTGMILGTAAVYAVGTVWLSIQSGMDPRAALFAGVIPFLPGDAIKIILALFEGRKLRNLMLRIGKNTADDTE